MFEIGRVTVEPDGIVGDLVSRTGLQVCSRPFDRVVTQAIAQTWTRDPFDRLIVAQAALQDNLLM